MSSTRYTHPRPAANSISNAILETLRTIEQGTEVHVLLHKLCSRLIGFKCQLLNHFDIGNVLVSNITANHGKCTD